ncbi:MAG: sn-glycerol-3-phosphate ABC transporter ATP-binding protein UgpC [Anaerolineae bacterium]|uniref:ABC transporter ATP-binding protein n=1 Tax=Candidatus Flexifilum breve TaxID=3140694 RepID=UPI001ACE3EED|nr:sn-glycerol-3-phosphate ABC transporter ATP-binding protein UgpC [Chloroflexota bacterium]MBK9749990.1 sn-glycerol-3-phosphate ABC transporter ATP-binding protein UgpC [Chloroflexota bacterium]MBN8634172.1 sn-glycerol-3-phosphate ABC transporter ATP-binding protein UgpC [Anaerolineae bacterium]
MASVSFRHVWKRYAGNTVAVKDLNIEIADKEFLILVGPSGCGKSTSLRMLAGLEEISEGEVLIGDRVVNNVAPKDRDVAMVFQSYALYPHMTVYDNMAFGLRLRKTPKNVIDERVRDAAKSLGIEHLLDRRPRQLSGGQRQRVAVGRAIVREPAVFLMDEPLSNLDAKLRVEARSFISKLHQRLGTTFVYVTHDQVEAMTMGTRICVMSAGELQQIDTPYNLYHNPRNIFVAGFIGSPSMNFFDGTLRIQDGGVVVDTAGFQIKIPAAKAEPFRARASNGERVILGVRPEDIHDAEYLPTGITPALIEANVDVVEQMGNEIILYLEDGGKTFISRTDPRTRARVGNRIGVALNIDNMHIFDADTQLSLAYEYKQAQPEKA